MVKKNERFEIIYKQDSFTKSTQVLVDKATGVNYVFHSNGYAGGLTPLLGRDGKPVITAVVN